jgi:hypothetical protein
MCFRATHEFQAELRGEITRLKARLTKLETLDALVAELLSESPSDGPSNGSQLDSVIATSHGLLAVETKVLDNLSWAEKVRRALEASGKDLSVGEIMDEIKRLGYAIDKPRNIFYNSVYTALKRSSWFEQADDNKWRMAETK